MLKNDFDIYFLEAFKKNFLTKKVNNKNQYKSFFEKKKFFLLNNNKKNKFFFKNTLYYFFSKKNIYDFLILINYFNKSYKINRLIFKLPIKKKRTHFKRKKTQFLTKLFFICKQNIKFFKNFKYNKNKSLTLFLCEYINSFWYFNFWFEWKSSRDNRKKITKKNPFIKWKFDLYYLNKNKILHFLTLKKKKKHNRRKFTMPKNTYNVGFLYGFSEKYITKILVNLQKKKKC